MVGLKTLLAITALGLGNSCRGVGPGDGIVCTAIFAYGLNVQVRDSVTGLGAASGASLVVLDGSFKDSVAFPANRPDLDNMSLSSAGERAGTYNISVRKSGYAVWSKSSVVVTSDVCHVKPVLVTALLKPGS